jgi:hypothetical protein
MILVDHEHAYVSILLKSFDMVYKITDVIRNTKPITEVAIVSIPNPVGIILEVLKISRIINTPTIPTDKIAKPGIPIRDNGLLIAM